MVGWKTGSRRGAAGGPAVINVCVTGRCQIHLPMSLFDVIFTESVPRKKRRLHERKHREARSSLANIVEDLLRVANVELVPRPQHTAIAVTITPQLFFANTRKSADVAARATPHHTNENITNACKVVTCSMR